LLAFGEKQPAALAPATWRSIIEHLVGVEWLSEQSPPKAAATLQRYEKLFAADSGDARLQLVLLRLARVKTLKSPDCADAEQAAALIASPTIANRARGLCEWFKADMLLAPYRDRLNEYLANSAKSSKLTVADDAKLLAIQDAYAKAMNSISKASDPKTAENLAAVVAAPLKDVESGRFGRDLTALETESLRLTIDETTKIRGQLYDLISARIFLHAKEWSLNNPAAPLPPNGRAAISAMVECLKPIRFLEVRLADSRLGDDHRDILRACDKR
jgi:hypothetical protein